LDRYRYFYPFEPDELAHVANFFESPAEKEELQTASIQKVEELVERWRQLHTAATAAKPTLTVMETADESQIVDTRPCACSSKFFLTGLDHVVYQGCRAPATLAQLVQFVATQRPALQATPAQITQSLEELRANRLLLHIKQKYLALANYPPVRPIEDIFVNAYKPFKRKELKIVQIGSYFQLIRV
jgi:hypothetical protein